MNTIGTEHLVVGACVVVFAALVMYLLVHRELAPQVGLSARGEWWLAAALGMGVVAFFAKMLAMLVIALAPDIAIAPLLARAGATVDRSYANVVGGEVPSERPRYVWQTLPAVAPGAAEGPRAAALVALGERLFHDKALSINREIACASCHDARSGAGADSRRTSLGIEGKTGVRNAPTVFNAAYQTLLFWDGRAASLEEQAKGPLVNPLEMGMSSLAAVEVRVHDDDSYRAAFTAAFGDGKAGIDRIADAIAAYERTLVTSDTPYDRFVRGDRRALNEAQLRGMALFDAVGCTSCHAGPNFSGAGTFDTPALWRAFPAVPTRYDTRYALTVDPGRAAPGSARGIWRIPSLRNVALTAPYFHNGSVDRLEDAVRVMASAQLGRPATGDAERTAVWSTSDGRPALVENRALTDAEVGDIVAFLKALSSDALAARVASPPARQH